MTTQSGFSFDFGRLKADADMASHQWKFVATGSAADYFELATGASGPAPLGVLQDDPEVNVPGRIRILGTTKVAASGAIGYGDFVTCASNAHAVVQASASAAVQGIALGALASGSGYIEVLLLGPGALSNADNTP